LGWKDREWSKVLSLASYDLLYYFLEAQLKVKQQVIAEANFKTSTDSPKMMQLITEYRYHAIQFHCYSEERVLLERFQNRANTPERHPGHVDHLTLDDLRISLELSEYQPLALTGSVYEVNTTDFSRVDYGKLTQDFKAFLHHP
jgi:predicted kinase